MGYFFTYLVALVEHENDLMELNSIP